MGGLVRKLLDLVTGGSWGMTLAGLAAVVIGGYVAWSQVALANRATEIATLTSRAMEAERVARANASALEGLKARHATEMAAIASDAERARRAARGVVVVKNEVSRDPQAGERVPAAVDRFLDVLRRPAVAADGTPPRPAGNPGGAAVVR